MGLLILVTFAGLVASLVDGALGMGFGPTSSTLLLGAGLAPAAVSTTVNVAKVASGLAGGLAHYRFGNVDSGLVVRLAVPGSVGALVGVTVLANVDGGALRPYLAGLLLVVGLRMLLRFSRPLATEQPAASSSSPSSPAATSPSATPTTTPAPSTPSATTASTTSSSPRRPASSAPTAWWCASAGEAPTPRPPTTSSSPRPAPGRGWCR